MEIRIITEKDKSTEEVKELASHIIKEFLSDGDFLEITTPKGTVEYRFNDGGNFIHEFLVDIDPD